MVFFLIRFSFTGAVSASSVVAIWSFVQRRTRFLLTDISELTLKGSDSLRRVSTWHSKGTDAKFCNFSLGEVAVPNDRVLLMNAVCLPMKAFVAVYGPEEYEILDDVVKRIIHLEQEVFSHLEDVTGTLAGSIEAAPTL